jgi:hypothetical protein
MATLAKAHEELFRRSPDECFDSLAELSFHCASERAASRDLWEHPHHLRIDEDLSIRGGDGLSLQLNDWSFSQLCRMAGVSKETINRLSASTASRALAETMPQSSKPFQLMATDSEIRSIHGVAYTRLWNAEVLDVVQEFAADFSPPQVAMDGVSTGLYCGQQDLFAFLIDPTGWTEIDGEAFAPGFFVWNSEVGRRSVGIQTFWFQRVCQNHIVWDATDVIELSRKHTANVHDALNEIRVMIERLVQQRDQRRDHFASAIRAAMTEKLGSDADEVTKLLAGHKIPRSLIKDALNIARERGGFTIFAIVDALTQLSQKVTNAGDRTDLDSKVGRLLSLAA